MMTNYSVVNTLDARLVLRYFVDAALRLMSNFATISGFVNATGEDNTDELRRDLVKLGFNVVPGYGAYKGVRETSLFVLPPQLDGKFSKQDLRELHRLAQWYSQESFLLANEDGYNFVYNDGCREKVGDLLLMGESVLTLDFHSNFAGVQFAVVSNVVEGVHSASADVWGVSEEEIAEIVNAGGGRIADPIRPEDVPGFPFK